MTSWICFCCKDAESNAPVFQTELPVRNSGLSSSKAETDETLTKSLFVQAESSAYISPVDHSSTVELIGMEFSPASKDYQLLTLIGRGSYSAITISLAKHLPSGNIIAVKRINIEICELNFTLIQHEIKMHKLLKHKNVLPLMCSFASNSEIWMIHPAMGYGSCRDLLHAHFREGFPEMAIAYILRDVVCGLDYIHSKGIIHRSVKASHILIGADGNVCLSGLRHCHCMMSNGCRLRTVHDFPEFYVNSLNWASRELLEQNLCGYDTKSDIYSLGITSCELANGVVPFQDLPLTQMLLSKIEGTTPRLLDSSTYIELHSQGTVKTDGKPSSSDSGKKLGENDVPDIYRRTFSTYFHEFIERCLNYDPPSRPSASILEQHTFFKQVRQKSIPPLTELLKPLKPIMPNLLPFEDLQVDDLANTFGNIETEPFDWTF
jgi:STE20-related kinase adapter protein alpha